MGLALDEPKDTDERIERDGLLFLLGSDLSMWLRMGLFVKLDYHTAMSSFTLAMSRPGGGGGCC